MDNKEKSLYINLFYSGKIYQIVINSKKTFKFFLIKLSGDLEIEEFENLRDKYILSYKNTNINHISDSELLENVFSKEIKLGKENEIEIRLKLEDKANLKPEMIPLKKHELAVFKIELKEKLDILEIENEYTHDLLEINFSKKVLEKFDALKEEFNQKKIRAIESKNYSFMLMEKIKNYLSDDMIEKNFKINPDIVEIYKNELKKYTYFDSRKYTIFLDLIEEKIKDLLNFLQNLSDDFNFSRVIQFTSKNPDFPKEFRIYENQDLLNHIDENSKNGLPIKDYLSKLPKNKLDIDIFRKNFDFYYKFGLSKIRNVYLENFDFTRKNEKIILEDILLKILDHNNNKIPELYVNFYYGHIANFISKINIIENLSLTENSLKLNGLEYLQPFNKIKKIYVDPSITKEKNLICKLMSENCNFDKKLNIFSNSEYTDYSLFSNLEKITINFSSKIAQMFNVSLSGNKLTELYIEDLNEDYKMNYLEKNKFNFNFGTDNSNNNINNFLSIKDTKKLNGSRTNSFNVGDRSKLRASFSNTTTQFKKFENFKQNFEKFHSKEKNYNFSTLMNSSPLKLKKNTLNFSPKKSLNEFFDVLNQNMNIHEKFNSFSSLKYLKFTNCLLNSKLKISHCSNLKEIYFADCLFNKPPLDSFASVEKLTFKTCFQKITLEELNYISEKFKNLNYYSIYDPTEEFLEMNLKSNLFYNLRAIELYRIYAENYDPLFKVLLKINAFEHISLFPDYKRCTDMLLLIKFLEFTLRYNSQVATIEFLVGIKFNPANIDRVKFFLRKLRSLKNIRLYMPKSEETSWREMFKEFKCLNWSIDTDTAENDILSYYITY